MKTKPDLVSLALLGCAAFLVGCLGIQQASPVTPSTTLDTTGDRVKPPTTVAASPTPGSTATRMAAATDAPQSSPVLLTATPMTRATATQPLPSTALPIPSATRTQGPTATRAAVWSVQLIAELKTGADDLAFSPDGSLLAVGSADYEASAPPVAQMVGVWRARVGRSGISAPTAGLLHTGTWCHGQPD